jgi:hypothetical protein
MDFFFLNIQFGKIKYLHGIWLIWNTYTPFCAIEIWFFGTSFMDPLKWDINGVDMWTHTKR